MEDKDVYDEMLSALSQMRCAIAKRFRWYCHVSLKRHADSIRAQGFTPKSDMALPEGVRKHLGPDAKDIICLNPLGSAYVARPVQQGERMCLAIEHRDLPQRLGLDWSSPPTYGLARVLRDGQAALLATEIFVTCADRAGTIVSYDPIGANVLRVFARGSAPNDLMSWPMLVATANDNIQSF